MLQRVAATRAGMHAARRMRNSVARFSQASAASAEGRAESNTAGEPREETHFGYTNVDVNAKKPLVSEVFHRVAHNYDVMNDVMSAGIHRVWKHELLMMLNPQPGHKHLDVAGGTGDVSFGVLETIKANSTNVADPAPSHITVCDINPSMLGVGEQRAQDKGYLSGKWGVGMDFVEGDAEKLPFEDNSFDAYTIAFGLRNVTHIDLALAEARRVLKPGGRFMCLEFSQLDNALLQKLYDAYSFAVIPAMGQVVANDRDSYQYLVESIRKFPPQAELLQRMEDEGLRCGRYTNLTNGVVAIHSAFKL